MSPLLLATVFTAFPLHQHLEIRIEPSTGMVYGSTTITVVGGGNLTISGAGDLPQRTYSALTDSQTISLQWSGVFQDDVEAGEQVGQIHNFSVNAHVGDDGVFLSDWARWYPTPINADDEPLMRTMSIHVSPIKDWTFVASGNLAQAPGIASGNPSQQATLNYWIQRPTQGMALVGNKHEVFTKVVPTTQGDVNVSVHFSAEHADKATFYLDAAQEYLQLYVPLLGKYPYDQFTVVENFFSSGFAYPGFTVLGPRVVGMAPRSLAPGYLDHELIHNWWGNGVYVDRAGGNWCEALTSFCANYGRRALEDGPDAARAYRRGLLNKVSLDPSLDNGPLAKFGSADPASSSIDRFVGYDKGAFIFMMLEDVLNGGPVEDARTSKIWSVLARFARDNIGAEASWKDVQRAAEAELSDRPVGWLDPFFNTWVNEHTVPLTDASLSATSPQKLEIVTGDGWIEVDPDYRYYRLLPAGQLSPTIAGTLSGTTVLIDESVDAIADTGAWLADIDKGDNLLLIGRQPIDEHDVLLATCEDAIVITDTGFVVDGIEYEGEDLAVLHTMNHPTQEGTYITLFYSVGDIGWERLRLIWYYSKYTTVVWNASETILKRVYEPSSKLKIDS